MIHADVVFGDGAVICSGSVSEYRRFECGARYFPRGDLVFLRIVECDVPALVGIVCLVGEVQGECRCLLQRELVAVRITAAVEQTGAGRVQRNLVGCFEGVVRLCS